MIKQLYQNSLSQPSAFESIAPKMSSQDSLENLRIIVLIVSQHCAGKIVIWNSSTESALSNGSRIFILPQFLDSPEWCFSTLTALRCMAMLAREFGESKSKHLNIAKIEKYCSRV